MLGKNRISFINSLKINKFRNEHKMFIVEGVKMVTEILNSDFEVLSVFSTIEGLNYLENRENNFEIVSADFERIPSETKELNDEQMAAIEKLLGKFDEDEDVTNVYHNMRE